MKQAGIIWIMIMVLVYITIDTSEHILVEAHYYGIGRGGAIVEQTRSS